MLSRILLLAAAFSVAGMVQAKDLRPTNLLVITLDTLRADHLPVYGYRHVETPAIDQLAREGVLFKWAVSQAPLTLVSHASILTGLYPPTHGVRNNGDFRVPDEQVTLAGLLKAAGYKTAAFVGTFILDARFGLAKGFDVYDDEMRVKKVMHDSDSIRMRLAEETTRRAIRWLESNYGPDAKGREPFFIWTHFYDPHQPYQPPEPFRSRYPHNLYDGAIAYTDSQLKELFDELKRLGHYDDTLIVLTADHGQSFGEHGESTHGVFIYESTMRIPLMFKLPQGLRAGIALDGLARHVDIVPTVADLLGLKGIAKQTTRSWAGRSLRRRIMGNEPKPPEVLAYAEAYLPHDQYGWSLLRSIFDGRYKYILAPRPELYDLSLDPHERENLAGQEDALAARLHARLEALTKKIESKSAQERAGFAPNAGVVAFLQAAGYMGGGSAAGVDLGSDPKDMIGLHERMNTVRSFVRKRDFDQALSLLEDLIKEDPGNGALLVMKATTLSKAGRVDGAMLAWRQVLERDPKSLAAKASLARIHILDKPDIKAAEKEVEEASSMAPKDPELWALRADLAQASGNLPLALELYRKADAMGDHSSAMLVGWGSALNKVDKIAEAREKLSEALEDEPDNDRAHYNLGVVRERGGELSEAEKEYRLAVQYNPKSNLSLENLGALYDKQGRVQEAEVVLKEALQANPDSPVALYNLGSLYLKSGRLEEALRLMKNVVANDPSSAFSLNKLGSIYFSLNKLDDSYGQYERVTHLEQAEPQKRAQAWSGMARARAAQGRFDESAGCLKQAIAAGGEDFRKSAAEEPLFRNILPRIDK